jgi:hypothetical protein
MTRTLSRPATEPKALRAGLKLLEAGFWVVAIHPRTKRPIGKAWGLKRWDEQRLRAAFERFPDAGIGICLGPGRAPGGGDLIDIEGDGQEAKETLAKLMGGEIPETPAWSSRRGEHNLFITDIGRLQRALIEAGGKEGTDEKGKGAWHLEALPGLEIRVGGFKEDGTTVKQVQSVIPPTPGDDGHERAWISQPKPKAHACGIATLPESAFAMLEAIAERIAIAEADQGSLPLGSSNGQAQEEAYHEGRGSNGCHRPTATAEARAAAYLKKIRPGKEGENGSAPMMWAACAARIGFDLDRQTTFRLLREVYGPRCDPPWTDEAEIWHKIDDAEKEETRPRGWLLRSRNGKAKASSKGSPTGKGDPAELGREEKESQPATLIRLAGEATLFHDSDRRAYAVIPINGHREVHPILSPGFRLWLKHEFYNSQGKPPGAQAFQDALDVIQARAVFDGKEEPVYIRVASETDRVYIDLGSDDWKIVEISPKGWRLKSDAPIRFRRPAGLHPLPDPKRGGSIEKLKAFINCHEGDFVLIVAWLAWALRGTGPYPALVLTGEQGAAKSSLAKLLRRLIDNHRSLIRAEPRDVRDLMISAFNSHVIALDNLSWIPDWLSDALCRLATGGGFATRTYYTMDDETCLDAQRPIIITGIEDVVTRGDLSDRSLGIHLPAIDPKDRRTEKTFWADFEAAAPSLTGALFDLIAKAMQLLPAITLDNPPRMADFALFGEAIGQAMGNEPGVFARTYRNSRRAANEATVEDSPVAGEIQKLVATPGDEWEGTAKQLLAKLGESAGEKVVEKEMKSKAWPKSPRGMGGFLRRLAPALRAIGVHIDFEERANNRRPIIIKRIAGDGEPAESR